MKHFQRFEDGENAVSLGIRGDETFAVIGLDGGKADSVTVTATDAVGATTSFTAHVRIDTPKERDYFIHGGILHYVLRQLADADS